MRSPRPGDLVMMDDGVIDRPLTGLVLESRETQWTRSSGGHDPIMEVRVLWDRPMPSNYTTDGIESAITWAFEDLLEVIQ